MTAFSVPLNEIDECFQGMIPSGLCSVSRDGIPNITFLSIVHRIDDDHIGLSRQFFNKTIANLQENPRAQVMVVDPDSGSMFRLDLLYERTDTEGPLFERVSTRLDAVASMEGMTKVFRLAAVDVCRVLACERVASDWDQSPRRRVETGVSALDDFTSRLVEATDVESLIDSALAACAEVFGCEHSFLLLASESGDHLYTVASRGYEPSGVGAEVSFGEGLIGVAAQRRQSVRINNMASDIAYAQAIRSSVERAGGGADLEKSISLPGLANALSQIAVPVVAKDQLLGVLCLQAEQAGRFGPADEAALNVAARQIGLGLLLLRHSRDHEPMVTAKVEPRLPPGDVAQVRYYAADDSIFVDNNYVIKGVAGRVLWRLLRTYSEERRVEFTNREVRLDPHLELPDIKDNLEARLILLRQRLDERCGFLHIQNTGRGRFRLDVQRPFDLREVTA